MNRRIHSYVAVLVSGLMLEALVCTGCSPSTAPDAKPRMASGNIPPAAIIACPQGQTVGANAQGVNDCVPGGGTKTVATVLSGQTYAMLSTDAVVLFDTTILDSGAAMAVLPSGPTNGEAHTVCWPIWDAGLNPIVAANAVDGGALMTPFVGQTVSGNTGLTTQTALGDAGVGGVCKTWKWNGASWTFQ